MAKTFLWSFVGLVLMAGAVSVFKSRQDGNVVELPVACTMDAKVCPDGSSVGRVAPMCQFAKCPDAKISWKFKDAKVKNNIPQTNVELVIGDKKYPLGTYEGSCSDIASSSWKLLDGEKSGAICWYAGGGTEIGIFEATSTLDVKKGIIEEGDGETGGTRGNFEALLSL